MFSNIPFRVIVSNIFPFHELENMGFLKEFDLFGYFATDRFRNMFFLFRSLFYNVDQENVIIDFQKVTHLSIQSPSKNTIDRISSDSPKMRNLESLSYYTIDLSLLPNIFQQENCFPNLRRLLISTRFQQNFHTLDLDSWFSRNHIWKQIESLSLTITKSLSRSEDYFVFPLLNEDDSFLKSLRFLDTNVILFDRSKLVETRKQIIGIPNLKELVVRPKNDNYQVIPLEFMSSQTTQNLERLSFALYEENGMKYVQSLFSKCPNIELIDLSSSISTTQNVDFLFVERPKPIKRLFLRNAFWSPWKEENLFFVRNIEQLDLYSCNPPSFEGQELRNLRVLSLSYCHTFTGSETFLYAERLTHIRFFSVPFLSDIFFQKNHFKSLRTLSISFCENLEGKDWNDMPEIRRLEIPAFRPVMKTMKFHKLEELKVDDVREIDISEIAMESTQKVRVFHVCGRNTQLKEVFYLLKMFGKEERSFGKLESMAFTSMEIRGEGMMLDRFRNLVNVRFDRCHFKDSLFRGDWVKRIRKLVIKKGKLLGEDFKCEFFQSLKFFQVDSCENFNEETFMENPPFQKNKVLWKFRPF